MERLQCEVTSGDTSLGSERWVSTAALERLESWGSNHEHHPAAKRSEAPGQAQAQLKHQRKQAQEPPGTVLIRVHYYSCNKSVFSREKQTAFLAEKSSLYVNEETLPCGKNEQPGELTVFHKMVLHKVYLIKVWEKPFPGTKQY